MKARKLIKNYDTKKYDIVFFGSHGYESKIVNKSLLLNNVSSNLSDLFDENTIEILNLNGTIYYNSIYLNLYTDTNGTLTISCDNPVEFKYIIQFNVFDYELNKNIHFQKTGAGSTLEEIDIEDLIDEYKNNKYISNFILILITETFVTNEFNIEFPEKTSKLIYNKKENYTYTYQETQEFNYAGEQEGVRNSLIPRLSVIKGELWYKYSHGLPLMEKIKSKGIYDSIIVRYITEHPDVQNIENFSSYVLDHKYTYTCNINTIYGKSIDISNE